MQGETNTDTLTFQMNPEKLAIVEETSCNKRHKVYCRKLYETGTAAIVDVRSSTFVEHCAVNHLASTAIQTLPSPVVITPLVVGKDYIVGSVGEGGVTGPLSSEQLKKDAEVARKQEVTEQLIPETIMNLRVELFLVNKKLAEEVVSGKSLLDRLSEAQAEVVKRKNAASYNRNMNSYTAVKDFLLKAEEFKGFVHGEYVRKVVMNALKFHFGSWIHPSVDLVFNTESNKISFLRTVSKLVTKIEMEYEEYTWSIATCEKLPELYYLYNSIGNIVSTVVVHVSKNYGYESITDSAYFIPSENRIVTNGISLHDYCKDCDDGIYRFTKFGYARIFDLPFSQQDQRYLNYYRHELTRLGENSLKIEDDTIILHGIGSKTFNSKLIAEDIEKVFFRRAADEKDSK